MRSEFRQNPVRIPSESRKNAVSTAVRIPSESRQNPVSIVSAFRQNLAQIFSEQAGTMGDQFWAIKLGRGQLPSLEILKHACQNPSKKPAKIQQAIWN